MAGSDSREEWFDTPGERLMQALERKYGTRNEILLLRKFQELMSGKTFSEQLRNRRIQSIQLITKEEMALAAKYFNNQTKIEYGGMLAQKRQSNFHILLRDYQKLDTLIKTTGHEVGHTFMYDLDSPEPQRLEGISCQPPIPEEEALCECFGEIWPNTDLNYSHLYTIFTELLQTGRRVWLVPET